jgi:ATP-dependent Lon protease
VTVITIIMAEKSGAYGTKAADTDFRKKWDKEEYAEKARKKDQDEKERMQENEERMKQGAICRSRLCSLVLISYGARKEAQKAPT